MEYTIYKIVDYTNNNVYIGSTKQTLTRRLQGHRDKKNCASQKILKNNNYQIIEIEKTDKENRYIREQYWMDNINCINKKRALLTPEQRKVQKRQNKLNEDREKTNERKKELYHYQNSWGGEKRRENNLLLINLNIFK